MAAAATTPAPLSTHGTGGRVESIDVVRGVACLWVLLHHSYQSWRWRVRLPVLWHVESVAQVGYLGVHLFLVISGFVLFFPVVRRHGPRGVTVDVRSFVARRARRILPPYYIAMGVLLVAYPWLAPRGATSCGGVGDVLAHVTMVFNCRSQTVATINGAFWSLALEWQLYLAFPVLLWVCRRGGLWAVVGLTLAVAVGWQTLVAPRHVPTGPTAGWIWPDQVVWYYALPGRCFEFAMGMAAAAAVAAGWRWRVAVAAAAVAVCVPVGAHLSLSTHQFGPFKDQIWGTAFAAVLVVAAALPPAVARLAPVRLLAWVGSISYSVYLVHGPLLQLAANWVDAARLTPEQRPWLFLTVGLPALVAAGFGFHLLAERPFLSAAKPPVLPEPAAPPTAVDERHRNEVLV